MLRIRLILIYLCLVATAAHGQGAPYVGRQLTDILNEFRELGVAIVYSTSLIRDDMRVTVEPDAGAPDAVLREILRPHQLTILADGDTLVVVRLRQVAEQTATVQRSAPSPQSDLENITVSASRYEISRDIATSRFELDQRTIQNMPDFGEDPLRITQRLPGAAASGASARTHFRGGEENEIGIMLNGQWLLDPFHVRDYQNIFSAIDARAINGVEVFTGGFPARYGDRMSGVVLMESLDIERERRTEIGVSVFNTSVLSAGDDDRWNWLVSARRGNLDLVIDPRYGSPSYADGFATLGYTFNSGTRLSFNALYADDRVRVVLETEPSELEQVVSETSNGQYWIQLDSRWSDSLRSSTIVSFASLVNRRDGQLNDAEKMVASVQDYRDIERLEFRQDWSWQPSGDHLLQWGFLLSNGDASYRYDGRAEYFGLQAMYEEQPDSVVRSLSAQPGGGSYAAYVADRWKLSPRTTLELGLRWDDQTHTGLVSDSQLSPRFNLLQRLGSNVEFRFSWGRYHQSQGIHELQIEDGIEQFWPAQSADHLIAGISWPLRNGTSMRIEAFHKQLRDVRPRFENLYDPLGLIPELQPDRVRLEPQSAVSRGLEISANGDAGPWRWWAQYTLSDSVDRINGNDEARSWDQRHAAQAGFGWSNQDWNLRLAASVHSGWPTTSLSLVQKGVDDEGEPEFVAVPGPRNVENYATFASVDFRLSRRFKVPHGSLLAFVEVSNAFNRRNECCLDWDLDDNDELERGKDYWLPLLPAVGILWEF